MCTKLRKVLVRNRFNGDLEGSYEAYFHSWAVTTYTHNRPYVQAVVGIVELNDGNIIEHPSYLLTFIEPYHD